MDKIFAADPATKFGWAHSSGASGTWDLSVKRDESSGMRLIRCRASLEKVHKELGINLLVYEAARNAGAKMQGALVVQAMIQSVIVVFCEDHGIEYRGYSPSEIKSHATGNGNAKKEDMVAWALAANPKIKPVDMDDNRADALALLSFATETYGSVPNDFGRKTRS